MPQISEPTTTWPWMSSPAGPNRLGSFSTPAAKMTGVASRNAKRAASSWSRPRHRPPTIVMPERLMPGNSAKICSKPIERLSR